MEVRFFAPGSLVSNLDFVESIFGNAGDPFLPENDAGLDVEHWTGHTGCVILAPHLVTLTKNELGLPHFDEATDRAAARRHVLERPRRNSTTTAARSRSPAATQHGVIVTLIADNYFGYCKKEVKTQISYAANLYGNAEEEHAGGAIAFPSYSLGRRVSDRQPQGQRPNVRRRRPRLRPHDGHPAGGLRDRPQFPDLIYIPEDAAPTCTSSKSGGRKTAKDIRIPLLPGKVYMTPVRFKCDGEASGRTELAAHRHRRQRHLLPQAMHRQRRRQERNQQVARRLHDLRPDLRRRSGKDLDRWTRSSTSDYADRYGRRGRTARLRTSSRPQSSAPSGRWAA